MALILRGQTRCSICKDVLEAGERIVGFPHFLGPDHELWAFSDSAMHLTCFEAWPEREHFMRLLQHREQRPPALDFETTRRLIAQRVPGAYVEREIHSPTPDENRAHDDEHTRLVALVRERGGTCPHCGAWSTSYREITETARARLVCLACARSCDASELTV